MNDTVEILPLARPPDATVAVPGSRSISNRALVCAALARGRSRLGGVLRADDTAAMADCLEALGATVDAAATGEWTVEGLAGRPRPGPTELHSRLSGTTSRFVLPLLALGDGDYRLDAAPPMRRRPMAGAIDALGEVGVAIEHAEGHLPLTVHATRFGGGRMRLAGDVSSQFISGLLLAGPAMADGLEVELTSSLKSRPYVTMTTSVMAAFGARVTVGPDRWTVAPTGYDAANYRVEPDASTAAYFLAAAAITGGTVRIEGLGTTSIQGDARFVDVLEAMGCTVTRRADGLEVTRTGPLVGADVDLADLSDQAPTLAAVAAYAETPTRVRGVGFIRAKESDRIGGVVAALRALGVGATEHPDGFDVEPAAPPRGGVVETDDDHRMAMSFALAGLVTPGVRIVDPACVDKTFPGFWAALDELGRPS